MARNVTRLPQEDLKPQYRDALIASGLVDGIADFMALDPRPYRFSEGDIVCRRGDKAHCLWIVVDGAISVRDRNRTLFVRQRHDVVGEQNLIGNGCHRWYDLVVSQSQAELLAIELSSIEQHPQCDVIWRNIAKLVSLKLKDASISNASLSQQLDDDSRILHAYTNKYALSRRLQSGGLRITDYRVDRAIIWFSDIVNFSRYILDLAPARTADIVQRFFNAQTHPIEERGGHIDKFMGDGLMAFWALPHDQVDRSCCEEAVKAAEEAVAEVAGISVGPHALELRVGLHLGLVLTGDFGSATRHQFTLIGPEVNKAARLEELHESDIFEGQRAIGAVRLSAELREELPDMMKRKYGNRSVATAKNIGELQFYS